MANQLAPPAPPAPWIVDFCKEYSPFLFDVGRATLIAGVLLGIALAVSAIVIELRKTPGSRSDQADVATTSAGAILDAVKGFIQALSSAPTWLAMFGGGILLLWLAGNAVPEICKPPAPPPPPCVKLCPAASPATSNTATPQQPAAGTRRPAATNTGQ